MSYADPESRKEYLRDYQRKYMKTYRGSMPEKQKPIWKGHENEYMREYMKIWLQRKRAAGAPAQKRPLKADAKTARPTTADCRYKLEVHPRGRTAAYSNAQQTFEFKFRNTGKGNHASVVREVLQKKVYKRAMEGGSTVWLDGGGHIGCFAIFALADGNAKRVYSYEPYGPSAAFLRANTRGQPVKVISQALEAGQKSHKRLYLHGNSAARHSTLPTRGRKKLLRRAVSFKAVLAKYKNIDGIKLDIEGAEMDILEKVPLPARIKTLAFEWSYSKDPRPNRLKKVIKQLKKKFKRVLFAPSALVRPKQADGVTWKRLPDRDRVVVCLDRKLRRRR